MVTPAATAQRIARRPQRALIISVAIALMATWSGLFIAFFEPYPVSFFITGIVFALYLLVRLTPQLIRRGKLDQTNSQGTGPLSPNRVAEDASP